MLSIESIQSVQQRCNASLDCLIKEHILSFKLKMAHTQTNEHLFHRLSDGYDAHCSSGWGFTAV